MLTDVAAELRSPGRALDASTRALMESRFGHDFGRVNIHTGASASAASRAVNARAFTFGQHVVFGQGENGVGTSDGRSLLAHELAHVIQQERGGPQPSAINGQLERDAESAATAFQHGGPVEVQGASAPGIARQPLPNKDEQTPQDPRFRSELNQIITFLRVEGTEVTDTNILAKALKLHQSTDGRFGGAVLAFYDRLGSQIIGSALVQATTPVVTETSPEGKTKVLVWGHEAASAQAKFEQEFLLGMLDGFAKAGLVAAGGALAGGVVLLGALAAPAVFALATRVASLPLTETATALSMRAAPRVMAWVARHPLVAETAFTGGVALALDVAETGSINPVQIIYSLLHLYGTPRGGGNQPSTPSLPPQPSPQQWTQLRRFAFSLKLNLGTMQAGAADAAPIRFSSVQPAATSTFTPPVRPASLAILGTDDVMPPTLQAPLASKPVTPSTNATASAAKPSSGPMRRAPGGGDRAGMTATLGTLTPHKRSDPVVETLPRSTVPMEDFEPPEEGHYIRRKPPSAETKRKILARAGRTSDGRFRDANTGRALNEGEAVWGHSPFYQFAEMRDMAERLRWTQEQFDEFYEDPAKWQIEYGPSNSSRVFDRIPRQRPVH